MAPNPFSHTPSQANFQMGFGSENEDDSKSLKRTLDETNDAEMPPPKHVASLFGGIKPAYLIFSGNMGCFSPHASRPPFTSGPHFADIYLQGTAWSGEVTDMLKDLEEAAKKECAKDQRIIAKWGYAFRPSIEGKETTTVSNLREVFDAFVSKMDLTSKADRYSGPQPVQITAIVTTLDILDDCNWPIKARVPSILRAVRRFFENGAEGQNFRVVMETGSRLYEEKAKENGLLTTELTRIKATAKKLEQDCAHRGQTIHKMRQDLTNKTGTIEELEKTTGELRQELEFAREKMEAMRGRITNLVEEKYERELNEIHLRQKEMQRQVQELERKKNEELNLL